METNQPKGPVIGIDLGGTNVRGGLVKEQRLGKVTNRRIDGRSTIAAVLEQIFAVADPLMSTQVVGIGIGVPSVVDLERGIVYDVQNIPSWTEVPLKAIMEDRYKVPVTVNNDANCFALGEFYFGKGQGEESLVGLTIGTGLGAGIIINNKLYAGANCGAGEIGLLPYLDKFVEYYAAGQFFTNVYGIDGGEVFTRAREGDATALAMYGELGIHLGQALKSVLYAYDTRLIVFGGSVRAAYSFFSDVMWSQLQSFAYPRSVARLRIELSELENSGILGAAALVYDSRK